MINRTEQKWIQNRFFNAFLVEESLVLLRRNEVMLKELGCTYQNTITVNGVGDFVVEQEIEEIKKAEKEHIKGDFHFIKIVNNLEERIQKLLKDELNSTEDYQRIFVLMSEHLAFYGLAKKEAEIMFEQKTLSEEESKFIEDWRNYKKRWEPQDVIWERIAKQKGVEEKYIHLMLIDEVLELLKGEKIDWEKIRDREKIWSLVEEDGEVKLFLEDKNPLKEAVDATEVKGVAAYGKGEIIVGMVGEEILVVNKTTPEMIEEIRKAKAVITDEGGILSHAAITAREFKIPTIIGTKNATKILRKGMRVEVDALNGRAKIIEKHG